MKLLSVRCPICFAWHARIAHHAARSFAHCPVCGTNEMRVGRTIARYTIHGARAVPTVSAVYRKSEVTAR